LADRWSPSGLIKSPEVDEVAIFGSMALVARLRPFLNRERGGSI
jgi:hypothetical protein